MEYPDILTMLCNLELDGENKLYSFYLQYMHQYQFTESEMRFRYSDELDGLDPNGSNKTHIIHYKVTSTDGLDYCWIPSIYCSIENKLRTPEEQDRYKWLMNIASDQPRDHVGEYKKITGQDLSKYNKAVVHNGYALYEEYLRDKLKNNGKVYGQTEERVRNT